MRKNFKRVSTSRWSGVGATTPDSGPRLIQTPPILGGAGEGRRERHEERLKGVLCSRKGPARGHQGRGAFVRYTRCTRRDSLPAEHVRKGRRQDADEVLGDVCQGKQGVERSDLL